MNDNDAMDGDDFDEDEDDAPKAKKKVAAAPRKAKDASDTYQAVRSP